MLAMFDVEHLLADALDRDVEVALERALHSVFERERHARPARIRRPDGQRHAGRLTGDGPVRREKIGGSFRRLWAEAGTAVTTARMH